MRYWSVLRNRAASRQPRVSWRCERAHAAYSSFAGPIYPFLGRFTALVPGLTVPCDSEDHLFLERVAQWMTVQEFDSFFVGEVWCGEKEGLTGVKRSLDYQHAVWFAASSRPRRARLFAETTRKNNLPAVCKQHRLLPPASSAGALLALSFSLSPIVLFLSGAWELLVQ